MFGGNVYVISSPDLIYSVQKQPRSLSFWYFEGHFTAKLAGLPQAAAEQCLRGIPPESTDECPLIDILKGTKTAMSFQGDLNRMVQVATKVMIDGVEQLRHKKDEPIDLNAWIQHEITIATTDAVYGTHNPYREPTVEAGFWDFANAAIFMALPNTVARIMAPRGWKGRETLINAMRQYFESKAHQDASQLVMARHRPLQNIIDDADIARCECTNGLAIIANTVPAAFWTVYHVFSDPALLKQVRACVETLNARHTESLSGKEIRIVDVNRLREEPLLSSIVHETLRYRARGTGPRMALEDITLSDYEHEYHIEKDAVIILAHEGIHHSEQAWGNNADQFIAERFLPGKKIPTNAFRGFGGGANMCPGKGFAITEITTLIAMLSVQFDIHPVTGKWEEPGQDESNMARENTPPIKSPMVTIDRRRGMENVVWRFTTECNA